MLASVVIIVTVISAMAAQRRNVRVEQLKNSLCHKPFVVVVCVRVRVRVPVCICVCVCVVVVVIICVVVFVVIFVVVVVVVIVVLRPLHAEQRSIFSSLTLTLRAHKPVSRFMAVPRRKRAQAYIILSVRSANPATAFSTA